MNRVDIGIDGILRGSPEVIAAAELERAMAHDRIEREARISKAVVDLAFAWRVLEQDVEARAFRYVPGSEGGDVVVSDKFLMSTTITDNKLQGFGVRSLSHWGGADYVLLVAGKEPGDMELYYREDSDDPWDPGDRFAVGDLMSAANNFDGDHLVSRAQAVSDYIYLQPQQRQRLRSFAQIFYRH